MIELWLSCDWVLVAVYLHISDMRFFHVFSHEISIFPGPEEQPSWWDHPAGPWWWVVFEVTMVWLNISIHINSYMGMGQYLLIPFLGEWTSIYQLFWCELQGYKVLTHCHISIHIWGCIKTNLAIFGRMNIHLPVIWGSLPRFSLIPISIHISLLWIHIKSYHSCHSCHLSITIMMFLAWKMLLDVTRAVKHRVMGIFWCVTNTQITGAGWIPPTPDVSYLAPMAGFAMEGYIMIYTVYIYNYIYIHITIVEQGDMMFFMFVFFSPDYKGTIHRKHRDWPGF